MRKLIAVLSFCALIFVGALSANAYFIDGDVDDWGVDLLAAGADTMPYLENNLPSGGLDIDYVYEDNDDLTSSSGSMRNVGPGWSHDNLFDAEAIYFDNDSTNAYIAIIQGMPISGADGYLPGDIAIDADNDVTTGDNGFELGLDVSNGHLYSHITWGGASSYPSSNPWAIASGTDLGAVNFIYGAAINTHHVLEAEIPLSLLGLSANPGTSDLRIQWTQQCGNDLLNLHADVNPIPEPNSLMLLATGLFGIGGLGFRVRRKKK